MGISTELPRVWGEAPPWTKPTGADDVLGGGVSGTRGGGVFGSGVTGVTGVSGVMGVTGVTGVTGVSGVTAGCGPGIRPLTKMDGRIGGLKVYQSPVTSVIV